MFITGRIPIIIIATGVPKRRLFLTLNTRQSEKAAVSENAYYKGQPLPEQLASPSNWSVKKMRHLLSLQWPGRKTRDLLAIPC
jgi:hypothetical protein